LNTYSYFPSLKLDRVFQLYILLLFWLPLPFGSNRDWAVMIFELSVFLLLLVWLIQFLKGSCTITKAFRAARPVHVCFGIFLFWSFLQTISFPGFLVSFVSPATIIAGQVNQTVSVNPYLSVNRLLESFALYGFFCLALLLVTTRTRLKVVLFSILIAGLLQAVFGTLMLLSKLNYMFLIPKEFYITDVTGTFINRNHLAGFLEMCLAVGVGLMIAMMDGSKKNGFKKKLIYFLSVLLSPKIGVRIALVIMVIALILTHSRMGNVAFFSAMLIASVVGLVTNKSRSKSVLLFFASMIVVDLFLVGTWFGIDEVAQRLEKTGFHRETRDEVYMDGLDIISAYPFTGTGGGTFESVYPIYKDGDVLLHYDHVHNDYLEFAIEYGLPATLVLGVAVFWTLVVSVLAQKHRKRRLLRSAGFASFMGIVAILIHSLVDFNLHIPANAAYFITLMALAWISRYGLVSVRADKTS